MSFLKKLLGFENSFSSDFTKDIFKHPTRLLTGIDPLSTKISNGLLGRDDEALVNMFGSPGQQYYDSAEAKGIDTGAGQGFHKVADGVAGIFGAAGLAGIGAGAAGAAGAGGTAGGAAGAVGGGAAGAAGAAGGAAGAAGAGGASGLFGSLGSALGGSSGWGQLASTVAGGLLSAKDAKDQAAAVAANNQAQLDANKVDPRITDMLFGQGPATGLLDRYKGLLDTPQSAGTQAYGKANENYIWNFTAHDLEAARGGANKLLAGNTPAPTMNAAQVNAPGQNTVNTASSFNSLINGAPGANPFLTGAIDKGIHQSSNAFGAMQRDSTKNLLENILPSLRSNSVIAGQYGGSRQGLAEGKALDSFATEQQRAMSQVGQNNTDAAVSAQAGAYESDMNRKLAATQALSQQQYAVASQNAAMRQASNQANLGSQLSTNSLNSSNTQAGMAGLGGLLSQASGAAGAQDMYDVNKAQNVNNLLQPYLNKNPVPTQLTPVYNNTSSSALSGAMAGFGMYNDWFKK